MTFTEIAKPIALAYSKIKGCKFISYLLKEDEGYLLLENGARIILSDKDEPTKRSRPSVPSYTNISKP